MNVDLAIISPHSSDQVQPLDLILFAVAKTDVRRIKNDNELSLQSNDIMRLFTAIQTASTTRIERMSCSFQRAGIITEYDSEELLVSLVITLDTKVRHYHSTINSNKTRINLLESISFIESDDFIRRFEEENES